MFSSLRMTHKNKKNRVNKAWQNLEIRRYILWDWTQNILRSIFVKSQVFYFSKIEWILKMFSGLRMTHKNKKQKHVKMRDRIYKSVGTESFLK